MRSGAPRGWAVEFMELWKKMSLSCDECGATDSQEMMWAAGTWLLSFCDVQCFKAFDDDGGDL